MARDYTTISVSQIDDQIASFALGQDCIHSLLSRNIKLAQTNLSILERFIDDHRWACQWTRPIAGTTAFVKFSRQGQEVDDVALCKLLLRTTGVMFCPGCLCFGNGKDFRGFVRIGFVCQTDVLKQGLVELTAFMKRDFAQVPLASERELVDE